MKNDIFTLLKLLGFALVSAFFLWGSIDFALNAKADTAGYANLLGNKLLPYQVLPYRIINFIAIPLWSVGLLVSLRFALLEFADLLLVFKTYIKKLFNK